MPLFEKADSSAYKCALSRIAETGSRLEKAEAEGAPDLQAAEQHFQEALDAYQAVRTGLMGASPQQMAGAVDGMSALGASSEGPAPRKVERRGREETRPCQQR